MSDLFSSSFNPALDSSSGGAPAGGGSDAPKVAPKVAPNVSSFVTQYAPLAERVSEKTGVAPEVLLGQWGLETGWGKSVIPGTNNLGNIKDFSGGGVSAVDNQTKRSDSYRKYETLEQFGDDFASLLARRYKPAINSGDDSQKFFSNLKRLGYAEDPGYITKGVQAANLAAAALGSPQRQLVTVRGDGAAAAPQPAADFVTPTGRGYIPARKSRDELRAAVPERGVLGAINDYVIEGANAAAGGVKAISDFVAPGNRVSKFIEEEFIKPGEESQSDATKLEKRFLQEDLQGAGGAGDEVAAYLGYLARNPGLAASQVAGSFAVPGVATAGAAGATARGAVALGATKSVAARLGAGVGLGTASAVSGSMSGGDAAGNAYDLVKKTPLPVLRQNAEFAELTKTMSEAEAVEEIATRAARKASAAPGAFGAVVGPVGAERILAGAGRVGRSGSRTAAAAKTGAIEAVTGGTDEGLSQYSGQLAASEYNPSIDPMRGVAGAATMGAVMEAVPGAVTAAMQPPAVADPLAPVKDKAAEGNSPLSRAAVAGVTAQGTAAPAAPVDPAARLAELEAISNGTPDQTVRGPNGQPLVIPGQPGRFFTQAEKAEYDALRAAAASPAGPAAPAAPAMEIGNTTGLMGPGPSADPFAVRAAELEQMIREQDLVRSIRTDGAGLEGVMMDLRTLRDPNARPDIKAQAQQRLEEEVTWAQANYAPKPAVPTLQDQGFGDPVREPREEPRQGVMGLEVVQATLRDPAVGPKVSDTDRQTILQLTSTAQNTSLPLATRQAAAEQAVELIGRYRAAAEPIAQSQLSAEPIAQEQSAPSDAGIAVPGEQQNIADGQQSVAQGEQTGAPVSQAGQRTPIPAGTGPAVFRKRSEMLGQLVANGFETVERRGSEFVLKNTKTGQEFKLDGMADAQLARTQIQKAIRAQADQSPNSPRNDLPESTVAQNKAGNYTKPPLSLNGYTIRIENPLGSVRRGVDKDGVMWESEMKSDYGYIDGTKAKDGDGVDVVIGNRSDSNKIFVIDQVNEDGSFDEPKVVMGVTDEDHARRTYLSNYEPGWTGLGAITEMTRDQFNDWLKNGGPLKATALGKAAPAAPAAEAPAAPAKKEPKAAKQPTAMGPFKTLEEAQAYLSQQRRAGSGAVAGLPLRMADGTYKVVTSGTTDYAEAERQRDEREGRNKAVNDEGDFFTVQDKGAPKRLRKVKKSQMPKKGSPRRMGEPRPLTQEDATAIEQMAALLGKKVAFFEAEGARIGDGFYDPSTPDIIYVATATTVDPLAVFGHEFFHDLRDQNPEAWNAIAAIVRTRVADPKGFRGDYYGVIVRDANGKAVGKFSSEADAQAAIAESGRTDLVMEPQSDAELSGQKGGELEELVSDLGGNLMRDPTFWRDVFAKIREDNGAQADGIIARLVSALERLVANVRAAIGMQGYKADAFVSELDAIRTAYRDGIAQYIQASGKRKASMGAEIKKAEQQIRKTEDRGLPGALTVEAYHFSQQPRAVLHTGAFGTGLKGSARDDIMASADERIKQRLYFYVNKGTGINPEAGVGGYAHKVTLSNIYDADADLESLRSGNARDFESRVLDAGYDGYLSRLEGTQSGQVILLGAKTVTPELLGQKTKIDGAKRVSEPVQRDQDLGDRIASSQALPAGELTPARWSEVLMAQDPELAAQLLEIGALEGDKPMYKDGLARRVRELSGQIRKSADRAAREYAAVEAKYKGADQWLKAPNGQPTQLSERQWVQVRTPSFKAWFGDWEQAFKDGGVWSTGLDVSKAVGENGEPLVVYHGTDKGGFTEFEAPGGTGRGDLGIWTTPDYGMARSYVRKGRARDVELPSDPKNKEDLESLGYSFFETGDGKVEVTAPDGYFMGEFDGEREAVGTALDEFEMPNMAGTQPGIYALFVNIRNPNEDNFEGAMWNGERVDQYQVRDENDEPVYDENGRGYFDIDTANALAEANPGAEVQPADSHYNTTDDVVREALRSKQDGAIIREVIDDGGGVGYGMDPQDIFVAFDPTQVKSANYNNGEFSDSTGDLRKSVDRSAADENRVAVVVGGKPGEFDWDFTKAGMTPPPYQAPTQFAPRLEKIGPAVQKLLSSKKVASLAEDAFGIKGLRVIPINGSWMLKPEPSYALVADEMTFKQADGLSKMLGMAFAQDATVVYQPTSEQTPGELPAAYIGNDKKLTPAQLTAMSEAAREQGLDYSTTQDGKAVKFLYFGDNEGLGDFYQKVSQVKEAAGFKYQNLFYVRSALNEASDYVKAGDRGDSQAAWLSGGNAGRSDLFGRTVDSLVVPYAKAVGAEGYRFAVQRFADKFGLSEQQRDFIREALLPKNGAVKSTVAIASGEEKLDITPTSGKGGVSVVDIMWALQNRSAQQGLIEPGDYSPRALKLISEAIAEEVVFHVQNPRGGKSAIGWYDTALKAAKADYRSIFPELATDADAEMLFDALWGITSQGNDVFTNSVFGARVYNLVRNDGMTLPDAVRVLRGTFGGETRAIENNILKLHELIQRNGYDRMRKVFNKKGTVSEINKMLKEDGTLYYDGKPLQAEGQADQAITGWMVFGPKIGSFINNLHGDYSTLTADLWFSRSWNRILGYSFVHSPALEATQYQNFIAALTAEFNSLRGRPYEQRPPAKNGKVKDWNFGKGMMLLEERKLEEIIADPYKALEFATLLEEDFRKGGYKEKSDLRRAAKNWVENRNQTVAAPRTDLERSFQQDAAEAAQKIIRRRTGQTLTIADIQAALWFYEKDDLFGPLGGTNKKSEGADYAGAADELLRTFERGNLYFNKTDKVYVYGGRGSYLEGFDPDAVNDAEAVLREYELDPVKGATFKLEDDGADIAITSTKDLDRDPEQIAKVLDRLTEIARDRGVALTVEPKGRRGTKAHAVAVIAYTEAGFKPVDVVDGTALRYDPKSEESVRASRDRDAEPSYNQRVEALKDLIACLS